MGFNGSIYGYFKGKKGLRQGDPLSPTLFVIAMNCLSYVLNQATIDGKFGYHARCEDSKLTHLCFADDLLIFTEGSLDSVKNSILILKDFEEKSGLAININKTCFFSAGLTEDQVNQIKVDTCLSQGSLPIRYLGVPLCTKKLTIHDCAGLIESVKTKMNAWASKALSFAGRLQLLNTVITGIVNFWSSSFILPNGCIDELNSLCSKFLWNGHIEGRGTARVSWEIVTKKKSEGGLGLRDFYTWNTACALKIIWILFFNSSSIWSDWFTREVLEGSIDNFWVINTKNSWLANELLNLRETIYPWLRLKIGNGERCFFWFSNWPPFGQRETFLGGSLVF